MGSWFMLRRTNDSRVIDETDEDDDSWTSLRVGLARFGWNVLKGMVCLVAAVLALEWFADRERPADNRAMLMRLISGEPGYGSKSLKVSPDGATFATTDTAGHVALWHGNDEWGHITLSNHGGYARTTAFSPDGRFLVSGGSCLTFWDLKNDGKEQPLPVPVKSVNTLEFSPDGRTLALASQREGEIVLWNLEPSTKGPTWLKNEHRILSLSFSPDGRYLAAGDDSVNASITIWDLGTGLRTLRLRWPHGPLREVIFSPDGKSLATASFFERAVRLWDVRSGKLLRSFAGHRQGTNSIAFSPDGSLLATGGSDGLLRLWTVATGELKTTIDGQSIGLLSVAFLPDGQSLAAAGYGDNDIRIWKVSQVGHDHEAWKHEHSTGPLLASISPTMSFFPYDRFRHRRLGQFQETR
jgi:WD40 repeat protein